MRLDDDIMDSGDDLIDCIPPADDEEEHEASGLMGEESLPV